MITVIAGVNGAGKSSVIGSLIRDAGGNYFNPDEVSRSLLAKNPRMTQEQANGLAWKMGFERLVLAVEQDFDHIFETTLGGNSICELLHKAMDWGREVRIIFCGLASPELHIQRVAARVAKKGHAIPEHKIHQRWTGAIHNMLGLIPRCKFIRVIDNSTPLNELGKPSPVDLFELVGDEFVKSPIADMPAWAKPLATAAIKRTLRNK